MRTVLVLEKWHATIYLPELLPSKMLPIDKFRNPLRSEKASLWRSHVLTMHDFATSRGHVRGK